MLKAVLIDLDNTLILYDETKFITSYFTLVASKFEDIFPPDKFAARLMAATMEVHKNNGSMTNRELFLKYFCQGMEQRKNEIWQRFERFYEEDFDRLKEMVTIAPCSPG